MNKQKCNIIGVFAYADPNLKFDHFLDYNPGIGGTEYLYFCLTLLLSKKANTKVVVFSPVFLINLPKNIIQIRCPSARKALVIFDNEFGGIFIFTPKTNIDLAFGPLSRTQIILWEHLQLDKTILKLCEKRKEVVANVVLSNAQANWMWKTKLRKKTVIINNFVSSHTVTRNYQSTTHIVFYIGAIYPNKHLDFLTKAWPRVIKKIPDAHLFVIGSSKVYSENAIVGALGISTPEYEAAIIEPLVRSKTIDSVSFLGKMDNLKMYNQLSDCSVGVVNPVGSGETFCISALNFGVMGIPVVGANYGGLKTTIPKNCGYRINTNEQLSNKIIELLKNKEKNIYFGNHFKNVVTEFFTVEIFEKRWIELIDNINKELDKIPWVKKGLICSVVSSFFDWYHLFLHRIKSFVFRKLHR